MYEKLKGKRLLFLGAIRGMCESVLMAKEMGITTIVIDYLPDSPAKAVADEAYLVSTTDVDAVVRLCKEKHIDGLFTGFIDSMLPYALEICERMGFPCYLNHGVLNAFCNKRGLKNALRKHGLPVIDEYQIDEIPDLAPSKFPLLVKPTDGSGSKGMSIIQGAEEFPAAYEKALSFSKKKDVLIERLMQCDDFCIGYLIQDGKIAVLHTCDRYVNSEQPGVGTIAAALIYPSKYTKQYFETTHEKVCKMIRDAGYKNGILNFQGFVEDEKIMFYDPAARLTGDRGYVLTDKYYGVNFMKDLIYFSLTGKMADWDQTAVCDPSFGGKYGCDLVFSIKPCKIGRIEGTDFARAHRNMIHMTQEHVPGDEITLIGTLQQCVFRMHLVADSKDELASAIAELQEHIKVYDEFGNDVMLHGVDPLQV